MAILVNSQTRLLCQGITGSAGSFHCSQMRAYGTNLVAGVTPGKEGTFFEEKVPVFNTVQNAVNATGANASVIFVPPPFAADAIMEAADAGIPLIVCITEGIPARDMIAAYAYVQAKGSRLIGPNCPGIITPGQCKIGIMPGHIHTPGRIGILSRSGTLTYEAVGQLSRVGLGQSTAIGIGGDPIIGTRHIDALKLFAADPDTDAVVMIGEIGGPQEAEAAEYIRDHMTKPVIAYVAGLSAPKGRKMGHAGAIISAFGEGASEKVELLRDVGVAIAPTPAEIGSTAQKVLKAA